MPDDEEQAVVGAGAPCGACRTLRRRCVPGCVFAPYFMADDFAAVHGIFGASNVSKMLERIELPEQRRVAAATLVEEAKARQRDPTFGRVSYLRILQEVNDKAREQVDEAREEIAREFGALAAAEPVDVAAPGAAVRVEARAQVEAALKHAREQDARLLGVRKANEARWRELHEPGTGTGRNAGNGKGPNVIKRHREPSLSEQTMLMQRAAKQRSSRPPGFPDERSHQQMAVAEAEREKALLMRQSAPAKQHGLHHLAAQHAETEPPRVPEVCGHEQLHQHMSEASREEAMRSVQAPPAASPQRLDSAGQHAGTGQPRHAGDAAAGRTPGQCSTSVLLEAMMQLAGTTGEQQQHHHLVAQHAENEHDITQEMMQLQELLDMAELARNQQIMRNDVMTEMGQWDAAAGGAREQDDQEMPQQKEEASTAELAETTGNMSQQFAWAQQYHDPAAVHHASPWHHQMAEAHQPAAASASQVASEQDMLLLLQQHQVAAAELLSAGGARQFNNLAAQYDDTELTLGYGHPDMHHQVVAAGQVAGVQDMNARHAAAAVHAEREMMQLAAGAQQQHQQQQQQHAQNGLDIALGNGHPDRETQAMLKELAAIVELADERAMIRKQWEQDVRTMMTQQDPDAAWLQEMLEQIEKASTPDLDKRLEIMSRQAEARHAQKELGITLGNGHPDGSTQGILQAQELSAMAEMERKREMLMRQVVAAGRAREQKLEMLMRQVTAAGRAREQELITQQAAAAQQQQHPVAQYSGTELDISLGQGHGHPYWHQPTAQQMLQEQQLPTVQQMLQEQQLADAVGFGRHQHNTTLVQQDAAYANGEHRGGAGTTMAFLSPGSAKDGSFLVDQQPQPNGHQMDSSLAPLPPSLGQLHAQASHQQRTDGGGQGLNSDLAAYLHYESLSRHGLAGNGRLQQG
ncbi:unnamed protein product [Miscanthus lutarioriparius]|uniref:LOB domain-containing protein n=1 Tax=Miscanthus lutarioriparius TaxID=422564 RepID=A0A811NGC8_9POAL|nr:unnamed protein product [Miscanthus lutarioriparius]